MPETTPLIKAALNLRVGVGFDVYDQTEVYWVHFTGSDVTNILRSYGLTDDKKVFYCGSGPSYQNLFRAMINELQMCKDSYQEMLEMYLRQIFIKLHEDVAKMRSEIGILFLNNFNETVLEKILKSNGLIFHQLFVAKQIGRAHV